MKRFVNNGGSGTSGFTRVDLMACLAVVGVLTALAASGISSSKDNVNRMVCASNMRQLAAAVGMYANDNQDYLPYCNWDGGAGTDPAPGWLYTLPIPKKLIGGGVDTIPDPFVAPWNGNRANTVDGFSDNAWLSGSLFTYVKTHQSYLCPTDIQSSSWTTEPRGGNGGRNNKLSSYKMNGASCNFGTTFNFTKVSDVWNPSCYLMWEVDENFLLSGTSPGAFVFNDGASIPSVPPAGQVALASYHGNNGSEVITVSGNVTFVTANTFNAQSKFLGSGPGGRTLCWWAQHNSQGKGQ